MKTQMIGDVLQSFNSARLPVKAVERTRGKTPYLGASGVVDYVDGFTHEGSYLCVAEDGANLLTRSLPIAWMQEGKFWANNHLHVLGGVNRNRLKFFQYAIELANIASFVTGSAQPKLNQASLLRVEVPAFGRMQENIIGGFLGSLDDKIAANNDVVSASNELIRNLYRALPESSRTLNEVASLAKNNEQPHRFLPDKRLVGLEHFDPKSLWLPRSSEPETATSAKTKFQAGDTLFGKLRPYFHKVAIAPFDGYCSTDILVLRAENPLHSPLVAAAANSDAVVQQAVNSSNGTRMPRAKWTDIEGCPIPDPDAPATLEFIEFAATLIQDATARLEENKALAKTRDELLPLLMSGKITVREASQEAAAAGAQIPSEENEV